MQSIIGIHRLAWGVVLEWWPLFLFVAVAEMLVLLQFNRVTRKRSLEVTLLNGLGLLLFLWGMSLIPHLRAEDAVQGFSMSIMVGMAVAVAAVRGLVSIFAFGVQARWALLSALPLPLFVYFTVWVTIK